MAVGKKLTGTREYVLIADRDLPKDQQTVWQLRRLNSYQMSEVQDATVRLVLSGKGGVEFDRVTPAASHMVTARHGICGWKNWKNEDGEIIEYAPEKYEFSSGAAISVMSSDHLFMMDMNDVRELAIEIQSLSSLSEKEAGKSVAVQSA